MKLLISSFSFLLVLLTSDHVLGRSQFEGEVLCSEDNLVLNKEQDGSIQRTYESNPPGECESMSDCPVDYCSMFSKHDDAPMELTCQRQIKDKSASKKSCQCNVLKTPSYSLYSTECYPNKFSMESSDEAFTLPPTNLNTPFKIRGFSYWTGSPALRFRANEFYMDDSTCIEPADKFVSKERGVFFTTDLNEFPCESVADCPADYCQTFADKIVDEYILPSNVNYADKLHLRCMRRSTMGFRCSCALAHTESRKCPKTRPGIFITEIVY